MAGDHIQTLSVKPIMFGVFISSAKIIKILTIINLKGEKTMKTSGIIMVILIEIFSSILFSQQLYEVQIPGNNFFIKYNPSNQGYESGRDMLNVGFNSNSIFRSYIYWPNIRNYVPAGSQVVDVKFYITWQGQGSSLAQLEFRDFSFGINIIETYQNIGSGTLLGIKSATTTEYSFTQLTNKVQNVVNGSGNDVWVGIKNSNESSVNYFVNFPYNIYLYVKYKGPYVQITQVDESGNPFGQVGRWFQNHWIYADVPFTLNLQVGDSLCLQSDTNYKSGTYQKYWKWTQNSKEYLTNHHNFVVLSGNNMLKATFKSTEGDITIRNNFKESNIDGGIISFADPWLIDYPDPQFGYTKRNRGMKKDGNDALLFYSLESPFMPNHQSHYKGVFLNQRPSANNPNQPYYSVRAEQVQWIYLPHIGRLYPFYFQGWSASPYGSAEFQNPNALETPVVFK